MLDYNRVRHTKFEKYKPNEAENCWECPPGWSLWLSTADNSRTRALPSYVITECVTLRLKNKSPTKFNIVGRVLLGGLYGYVLPIIYELESCPPGSYPSASLHYV